MAAARAVIFSQMVDDPSAYVDVLRADPKLHRKAETALKARLKVWEEACELARKAKACRPMACTMRSRDGEPVRSQTAHGLAIALSGAHLRVPACGCLNSGG